MNTYTSRLVSYSKNANFLTMKVLKRTLLLSLFVASAPLAMAEAPGTAMIAQFHETAAITELRTAQVPTLNVTPADANGAGVDLQKPFSVALDVVKKPGEQEKEVKVTTQGILNMMALIQSNKAQLSAVKVPSYNYLAILQELQNRNARFLLPGAEVPATATVVFRLQSEQSGMSQTVYFSQE